MKLAIGIRVHYPQEDRHRHCIDVLRRIKRKFNDYVDLYNVTFFDEANLLQDFIHLPFLKKSSQTILGEISTIRLQVASETFDVLSNQDCDYFLYLNNDILLTERVIKFILKGECDTYSFSRHDINPILTINDDITPIKIEIAGFDAWCCNTRWWMCNKHLFKEYLVGQWQWDVDFALTMYSCSNGEICNNAFYIAHEEHPRKWNTSSVESTYNDTLWNQRKYAKNWGEYVYSNLIHRLPSGQFLVPLPNEEQLKQRLLKFK
jgi:hypothetical protein